MASSYTAKLIMVAAAGDLRKDLKPFVDFHAGLLTYEVDPTERVAILQIMGTGSYFPVFLDRVDDIEAVEARLAKQESVLNNEARKVIERHLSSSRSSQ